MHEPIFYASENPNPVFRADFHGTVVYGNQPSIQIMDAYGFHKGEKVPSSLMHAIDISIEHQEVARLEITCAEKTYLVFVSPVLARSYVNIYGFDISEHKESERQMLSLKNTDPLTGLLNRTAMLTALTDLLKASTSAQPHIALIVFDLNGFRAINNSLGSEVGDYLLKFVAMRLARNVPSDCVLAHITADEFAVICNNVKSISAARKIAQHLLGYLARPYEFDSHQITLTFNVGCCMATRKDEGAQRLLTNANIALDQIVSRNRNHIENFHPNLLQAALVKQQLKTELANAITHSTLSWVLQPQYDLSGHHVVGAEALIRWHHPQHGYVSPPFIGQLADETGLTHQLGWWMVRKVLDQLVKWRAQNRKALPIAINLPATQITSSDFLTTITSLLKQHQLAPDAIEIEVLESELVSDSEESVIAMQNLKNAGFSIAMDDYGTGYSSLSYLSRFPFHKIKIDKNFVDGINHNEASMAVLRSSIAMAHSLNMKVLAEGVEDDAQVQFLQEHRCDYAQGYRFSKPLPLDEFEKLLT